MIYLAFGKTDLTSVSRCIYACLIQNNNKTKIDKNGLSAVSDSNEKEEIQNFITSKKISFITNAYLK